MTNGMKFTKTLVCVLALSSAVLLASCRKEMQVGIDGSKPAPAELEYDPDQSSATSVSLYWDAEPAVKAGAGSVVVQLTKSLDRGADMYDSKTSITLKFTDEQYEATIFTGLKEYDKYYARIRANYPHSVFSEWTYLKKDGAYVLISVGHGVVVTEFVAPPNFSGEAVNYSTVNLSWDEVLPAKGYEVSYARASSGNWTTADAGTNCMYSVKGLEPSTPYTFRVAAYNDGGKTEYSTIEITTPDKPKFGPAIKTAEDVVKFFNDIAGQSSETDEYYFENDIDLKGAIIPGASSFAGILDGKGYAIKNATINNSLFERLTGTVKNLVIGSDCSISAGDCFGTVAKNNAGVIEGCRNRADLTVTAGPTAVVGGLVCMNRGRIEGCENAGKIILSSGTHCPVIGGIVAFTTESLKNDTNSGNISVTLDGSAIMSKDSEPAATIGAKVPPSVGGICGICHYGTDVSKGLTECLNKADISISYTTGSYERTRIAGICGTSIAGSIVRCENAGKVSATFNMGSSQSTGQQFWAAGITNANIIEFKLKGTYGYPVITDCSNSGEISLWSDNSSNGYCYVGGIVSVADIESLNADSGNYPDNQLISGCTNTGRISADGYSKPRAAGIAAAAANVRSCVNRGDVVGGNNLVKESQLGGIVGFANGKEIHDILNCENYGKVSASGAVNNVRLGGLFGQFGGTTDKNSYSGNKVNCTVEGSNACNVGIIGGYFNNTAVNVGSDDNPNLVAGTVIKGGGTTTLTEANFSGFIAGNGSQSKVKVIVKFLK